MQSRMGVALVLLLAGTLAVGCASAQSKQREEERKIAKAEQKQRKAEARRIAAEDKRRREEDKKMAEQRRKEEQKYEKEQKDAFASDFIRDERMVRSLDRLTQAVAASGAVEDATLTDAHFDAGELNALGRSKMALIARGAAAEGASAVVVYVGGADANAAQPRVAAVQSYLKASPYADLNVQLKPGVNEDLLHSSRAGMSGLQKMEKDKSTGNSRTFNFNVGGGSSGGSPAP